MCSVIPVGRGDLWATVGERLVEDVGVADMQAIPLGDAGFDRVLSTFGAMFATEPRAMARELLRLCRAGGMIAACAWTPDGVFGRVAPTVASFLPSPLPGPRPTDWGTPGARAQRQREEDVIAEAASVLTRDLEQFGLFELGHVRCGR